MPPFLLAALSFGIATTLILVKWIVRRENIIAHLRQPIGAWALGVCGLFGYHFFYFMALRNAPPVEAGLIAYMWPLLIVLFSALLPGERLRWWHVVGAITGFVGAALLVTGGNGLSGFKSQFAYGYGMAVACALTWSIYSVTNRRFTNVPTDTVGGFCAVTALLAGICHVAFEQPQWPETGMQWMAIVGLGLLPVGAAFFAWDYGTKHGNIQALGAFSYAAPLISTLVLIAFGQATASWFVAAACLLIVGGAVIASKDLIFNRAQD